MNGESERVPRIIVGVSRSQASWWALAWAVGEVRRRGGRLVLVHVFRPSAEPSTADYRAGFPALPQDPYRERVEYGYALIRQAIHHAVGWLPCDIEIEQQVLAGRPPAELAGLAHGDDLIVIGARHRGPLRRLAPGSVGRACARRANCPVVAVPEPSAAALVSAAAAEPARKHRHRWGLRSARTASKA